MEITHDRGCRSHLIRRNSTVRLGEVISAVKFLNAFLFLAISLLPIYSWSSGGMQASHYVLAFYCGSYLIARGLGPIELSDVLLLALVAFVVVRESFAVLFGAEVRSLLPPAHLFFSFVVFNVLRRTGSSEVVSKTVLYGLLASAAVAVAGVLIVGYGFVVDSEGGRAVGTFNNPNQLGYFAVCLFSLAFLFRMSGRLSTPLLAFMVGSAFFLASASLSKAAMVGIILATMFAGFAFAKRGMAIVSGVAICLAICGVGYWLYTSGLLDDYSFVRRLQGIGSQSDDSLEGRGYWLFLEGEAFTLLFGFGLMEVLGRVGHEVHSTIFSFFVNYGVFGGALFSGFILLWIRRVWFVFGPKGLLLVVGPVMLYGITHNGSRFTIFWILLALSFADLSFDGSGKRRCVNPRSGRLRGVHAMDRLSAASGLSPLETGPR